VFYYVISGFRQNSAQFWFTEWDHNLTILDELKESQPRLPEVWKTFLKLFFEQRFYERLNNLGLSLRYLPNQFCHINSILMTKPKKKNVFTWIQNISKVRNQV
jgi:hypothetical protein